MDLCLNSPLLTALFSYRVVSFAVATRGPFLEQRNGGRQKNLERPLQIHPGHGEPQGRREGVLLREPGPAELGIEAVRPRIQQRRPPGHPVDGPEEPRDAERLLGHFGRRGGPPGKEERGEAEDQGERHRLGVVESANGI